MPSHSLTSVLGLVTDERTGKVILLRVCAYCEKEKNEFAFVQSYLKALKINKVSHGICTDHYNKELEKLKVD